MKNERVALVTGARRGIGRGITLALAEQGFRVVGNDIRCDRENPQQGLYEVGRRIEEMGGEFLPVQGDISSSEDQERLLEETYRRFGRLDVLVNNAGVAPEERKDVLETTPESYDRLMGINARGTFFLTQKAVRRMLLQMKVRAQPRPCIIFITSISAEVSSPARAEYCISKAALSMTARIFADRLGGDGINVYEIRPGIIRTDMTAQVREKYDRLIGDGLVPQRRWGFPQDVGRAVAALARGDFSYATGLILELSGGMNIRHL